MPTVRTLPIPEGHAQGGGTSPGDARRGRGPGASSRGPPHEHRERTSRRDRGTGCGGVSARPLVSVGSLPPGFTTVLHVPIADPSDLAVRPRSAPAFWPWFGRPWTGGPDGESEWIALRSPATFVGGLRLPHPGRRSRPRSASSPAARVPVASRFLYRELLAWRDPGAGRLARGWPQGCHRIARGNVRRLLLPPLLEEAVRCRIGPCRACSLRWGGTLSNGRGATVPGGRRGARWRRSLPSSRRWHERPRPW